MIVKENLEEALHNLKQMLQGKEYRIIHSVQDEGDEKGFFGKIYNPFAPEEILYEIVAYHNIENSTVQLQSTGIAEATFSFSVRRKQQGISLLVQYFELLDYDFIDALFHEIVKTSPVLKEIWNDCTEQEREDLVLYVKDVLLSAGLPVLDMPSLMIEDMLQDVGVL
ncbi:hypothetical protein MUG87_07465 [Ectobacillus sp. JY-23]|uniref:hypothetical protein n=1 Tax=Ectobacillus sp. JY-23 TaxID=2933872 RepID=UPI001FF275C8|nr:hypothetical protein [Ectobacillus sp. JY-23]UOY93937.1 hypothetical protein MUG87_07465 [Ectobacillus sp. JY-23]